MIRYRIKDATLIPVDDTLTMVSDTPDDELWSSSIDSVSVADGRADTRP
jgi:hypothetical protein